MEMHNPPLRAGNSPVPAGMLATVVTCLETRDREARPEGELPPGLRLQPLKGGDLSLYRALYDAVGADWLWVSRLFMGDDALRAHLDHPATQAQMLVDGQTPIGLVELDFASPSDCEVVYFGLVASATGRRLGPALMAKVLDLAWARPVERVWLHTCHLDHPAALSFYRRMGFSPFATYVEVLPDPRLKSLLPREAAPHVPLIEG